MSPEQKVQVHILYPCVVVVPCSEPATERTIDPTLFAFLVSHIVRLSVFSPVPTLPRALYVIPILCANFTRKRLESGVVA